LGAQKWKARLGATKAGDSVVIDDYMNAISHFPRLEAEEEQALAIRYREEVPEIDQFGNAIMGAMVEHFGNNLPEMLVEPGLFIVGDAGLVQSEVVLVSCRDKDSPVRWVYLDIGRFGGLAETEGESIRYAITTPHDGTAVGPVAIAGPSCDGADIMYEKSNYRLPLKLTSGDKVELRSTGAYVTTYCSTGFNGFAPLTEYYL